MCLGIINTSVACPHFSLWGSCSLTIRPQRRGPLSECLGDFLFNEPLVLTSISSPLPFSSYDYFEFYTLFGTKSPYAVMLLALTCSENQGNYVDERFLEKSQLLPEAEETQSVGTKLRTSLSDWGTNVFSVGKQHRKQLQDLLDRQWPESQGRWNLFGSLRVKVGQDVVF